MNTYLGISSELGPEDVSGSVAQEAEYVFLEGYLFDKDKGKRPLLSCRGLVVQPVARPGSRFPIPSALNGTARIFWI